MEGIYKCTAENKANATTLSAFLRVFGKDRKIIYFIRGVELPYEKVRVLVISLKQGVNQGFWTQLTRVFRMKHH